ncbi:VOC family protein [Ferruginibacter yonginensis]|uniref:VOC family protein n=1 Tax=Ferruginibacter yonginensis TaxID=1310416 RepID=A0ABV8QPT9_9BACT
MAQINPHLLFKGNTEEAFQFYQTVFGGEITGIMRMKDFPSDPEHPLSESAANKIIQISLPIGEHTVLMGSDVGEQFMDQELVTGNRYTISVTAANKAEGEHIFNTLAQGGIVEMPFAESFWGSHFGMLADKYGIQWMVNVVGTAS